MGNASGSIRFWDINTTIPIERDVPRHSSWESNIVVSPCGNMMAYCYAQSGNGNRNVGIFDIHTGNIIHSLSQYVTIHTFVFSPNETILACIINKDIILWNFKQNTIRTLNNLIESNCIAFSPDGQILASGNYDNTVKLWLVMSGNLLNTYSIHIGSVTCLAFSPDGTQIASGSRDKTIVILSLRDETHTILKGHKGPINSIAYSPDSTKLASGSSDNRIIIWDAKIGAGIIKLSKPFHTGHVNVVVFSPNGTKLISGSQDKTIKIWDVMSGEFIRELIGHKRSVTGLAI